MIRKNIDFQENHRLLSNPEDEPVWNMTGYLKNYVVQEKMKKDSQVTGNIGLYWACFHLSRMGWNAMPTARNARGVDIIVYNRNCSRMIAIQVKTLSKRNPVPLGSTLDKVMGDFWVVVNNAVSDPQSYVLRPDEVKNLAHRGEKEGRVSYWLQPSAYCVEQYHEAWGRIGEPH